MSSGLIQQRHYPNLQCPTRISARKQSSWGEITVAAPGQSLTRPSVRISGEIPLDLNATFPQSKLTSTLNRLCCTERENTDNLGCHGTSDQYDSLAGRFPMEKRRLPIGTSHPRTEAQGERLADGRCRRPCRTRWMFLPNLRSLARPVQYYARADPRDSSWLVVTS
jgi:hypothetical protein